MEEPVQPARTYAKKMFEVASSAGKLHIEVNAFQRYFFVVVTYASLLRMDGPIQLVHPTPYVLPLPRRTPTPQSSTSPLSSPQPARK